MLQEQKQAFLDVLKKDPYDETTHKVFADWLEENGLDDEAMVQRDWTKNKQKKAEAWFQVFSDKTKYSKYDDDNDNEKDVVAASVEQLIEAGREFILDGQQDYVGFYGISTPDFVDHIDWEKYWEHWEVLTGIPVSEEAKGNIPISFGCSC